VEQLTIVAAQFCILMTTFDERCLQASKRRRIMTSRGEWHTPPLFFFRERPCLVSFVVR
jgi:hypothetical protein